MTREEAIEFGNMWLQLNEDCKGSSTYEFFHMAIKALEQEPKTGQWVKIKPYPLQMHDYECSECGHETDDNTENYCSDCGAKMLKLQESEE